MLRSSLVNCLFHFLAHCLIAFETFSLPVPWPPLGLLSQTPRVDPGSPCWKEAQTEVEAVDGGRVFVGVGPPGVTYWVTSPGTWHPGLGCLLAFALRFRLDPSDWTFCLFVSSACWAQSSRAQVPVA